jgi:hypothetical protein
LLWWTLGYATQSMQQLSATQDAGIEAERQRRVDQAERTLHEQPPA